MFIYTESNKASMLLPPCVILDRVRGAMCNTAVSAFSPPCYLSPLFSPAPRDYTSAVANKGRSAMSPDYVFVPFIQSEAELRCNVSPLCEGTVVKHVSDVTAGPK